MGCGQFQRGEQSEISRLAKLLTQPEIILYTGVNFSAGSGLDGRQRRTAAGAADARRHPAAPTVLLR